MAIKAEIYVSLATSASLSNFFVLMTTKTKHKTSSSFHFKAFSAVALLPVSFFLSFWLIMNADVAGSE